MSTYKKTIRKFEKWGEKSTRTLKDIPNAFKDEKAFHETLKKGNIPIYNMLTKNYSPIKLTLTEVYPGTIGKEYYFTKGHVHTKRTPEFYILLEGSGRLLLQKNNKPETISLKLGEITLIPKGYAHRVINIGKGKLKVLTIYHEDSKPSYNVKFKKRFFKK